MEIRGFTSSPASPSKNEPIGTYSNKGHLGDVRLHTCGLRDCLFGMLGLFRRMGSATAREQYLHTRNSAYIREKRKTSTPCFAASWVQRTTPRTSGLWSTSGGPQLRRHAQRWALPS
ncbi:unnamed protein product [Nesidiocoris tenuis]|uniref:Uncharacterized protein n=1 Tax=Nesidiocoris tenuis TaxID=355587 RepID=A0A6H5G619_9HEMI|nr:unnamed protein product [Nesidiocoris tenuis]